MQSGVCCVCVWKKNEGKISKERDGGQSRVHLFFLPFFRFSVFYLSFFLFVISLKANDSLKGFFFSGGCGFGSVKGKSCPPRRDLRPCLRG